MQTLKFVLFAISLSLGNSAFASSEVVSIPRGSIQAVGFFPSTGAVIIDYKVAGKVSLLILPAFDQGVQACYEVAQVAHSEGRGLLIVGTTGPVPGEILGPVRCSIY